MVNNEPQGWYQDPFRRHEARYFSAGRPTRFVRDGNVESYDDPLVAGLPQRAEAGHPDPPWDGAPAQVRRRPRAGLLMTAAVIAVAGAVTAVMIATRPGPPTVRMSPAAFVIQSAQRTLSARTADVTISGSLSLAGQSIPIHGTGQTDFSANSLWLNTSYRIAGHAVVEKEVETNGNLYMSVSSGGQDYSKLTGGREWIQAPVHQQGGSANLGGASPASSLAVLKQHGNTVRTLGTKVVGGVTCTGYSVTPGRQAMIAAARQESAKLGLRGASESEALQAIGSMLQPKITVCFDAQGLLRQMSMRLGMQLQAGSSKDAFDATMVMNFTNYGTPVRISAPPPSDTISYSSFLKGLGSGS